jgi:HEPN domain-containing protein
VDEAGLIKDLWRRGGQKLLFELRSRTAKSKRLRQAELRGEVGPGERQLRNLEKGKSLLFPNALSALCVNFDLSLPELLRLFADSIEAVDTDARVGRPGVAAALPPGTFILSDTSEKPLEAARTRRRPATRWRKGWSVVVKDLECAEHCLKGQFYPAAVFHAHFAAGLAVRQLASIRAESVANRDSEDRAARIIDVLEEASESEKVPEKVRAAARRLDTSYLALHYSSSLPPASPPLSDRDAAEEAIKGAKLIQKFCENRLLQWEREQE